MLFNFPPSGVFLKKVLQHGQKSIMLVAMMETVAQNQIYVNMVNVKGSVLHVIVIVNHAMAVAAVCMLAMVMWKANVLVKLKVSSHQLSNSIKVKSWG